MQGGRCGVDEPGVEVVADLIVDGTNEAPALQPRQCPDLLCRPCAGIRQLNPAERHVLPATRKVMSPPE